MCFRLELERKLKYMDIAANQDVMSARHIQEAARLAVFEQWIPVTGRTCLVA